jgi:outer membrane protein OmpA-like peptidoglycan-associated protein
MVLRNIFFMTDQYDLLPESFAELDKLYDFLKQNPAVRIEIGGHTDNQGTEDYNAALSLKRAGSVAVYLLEKGIDPARISFQGYGETTPVSPNDSAEGRALNRRTEIRVTRMN